MHDQIWRAGTITCHRKMNCSTKHWSSGREAEPLSWSKGNSQLCLRIQIRRLSSIQLPRNFKQVISSRSSPPKKDVHLLQHPSRDLCPSLGTSLLISCTSSFASSSTGHSVHSWKNDLSCLPTYRLERCRWHFVIIHVDLGKHGSICVMLPTWISIQMTLRSFCQAAGG